MVILKLPKAKGPWPVVILTLSGRWQVDLGQYTPWSSNLIICMVKL